MHYESDDIMVVKFNGDVMICPGYIEGMPEVGSLAFVDNCGKSMPINTQIWTDEEWDQRNQEKGIKTDLDMNTFLRFVFEKTESIDCIIWGLQRAKELMLAAKETQNAT